MNEVKVVVVGTERVAADLAKLPSAIAAQVRQAIDTAAAEVQATAKASYLHGPRPQHLGVRSGRLTRSVNVDSFQRGEEMGAAIGTNVIYGRFWELGFHGTQQVRAHTVHRRSRDVNEVFRSKDRLKRRKVGSGVGFVRAHDRQVDVDPRPFLQPALVSNRELIHRLITQAVERATND